MGSGASRDSTDQRTSSFSDSNNRSEDRERFPERPAKRIRRSRNPRHTNTTREGQEQSSMDPSSTDDLEALQNDLEEVERGLNERHGIWFSGASSGRSDVSSNRGGRAFFESIGSALGNIRERLHELTGNRSSGPEEEAAETAGAASSDAAATTAAVASASFTSSTTRRESLMVLSQRLNTAELSHSTRMPLNLLQSELSRRDLTSSGTSADSAGSATSNAAVPAPSAARASASSSESQDSVDRGPPPPRPSMVTRRVSQRRSSALLASRIREDLSGASVIQVSHSSVSVIQTSTTGGITDEAAPSEASITTSQSLVTSIRTTLPMSPLQERQALDESVEMWIEEEDVSQDGEDNDDGGLILPDSARKHKHLRPSMRGSLRILGDEVVRKLADLEADEEVAANDHNVVDEGAEEDAVPDIPAFQLYTWGTLEFSESGSWDDAKDVGKARDKEETKEDTSYRLFGASDDANTTLNPRCLPSDTRLGRSEIISMSASETHCAFATDSGRLLICGNNSQGAVDPSRRDSLYIPRPMHLEAGLAMNRIKKVSCGINHTAVVTETKSVLTWGCNGRGQLGHRKSKRSNGSCFVFPKAFILGGGRRADNVVCCDGYTLVLTTRMEAYVCGGETMTPPEGGHPLSTTKAEEEFFPLPKQSSVLQGLPLVGIASGMRHLVVWTAHGTAYAWGCNESGQCGREYPRELKVPVPIGVPKSSQVPVPDANLSNDSPGSVSSFLKNWNVWKQGEPMSLASDVHIVDAACGKDHTVLVTDSGRLLVCGSNANGQLGVDSDSDSNTSKVQPVEHPDPDRRFQFVEAGTCHTLLLDDSRSVWQMGNGESSIRRVPSFLPLGTQICSISAGGGINFATCKSETNPNSCAVSPSMPELDDLMNAIRSEQEQKKDSNSQASEQEGETQSYLSSIEDLARGAENLFRSPAVMNSLFVDPKEIDHMYQTLLNESHTQETKQKIASAIERGMLMGLKSVADSRLIYFESVRFLLLYLQCPLWREEKESKESDNEEDSKEDSKKDSKEEPKIIFDARGDLLFLLCETILGLPFEGYKRFLAWSATVYGQELFVPLLVKPLVHQLDYRFINNITHGVPMIAGVLRWLHTVNERSDYALARGQDFHCSGIDEMSMEALFEDLAMYQIATDNQRSSNFFLAAHPFLMNTSVKQKLLQVEHQMSMVEAAQADGVSYDAQTREFKFKPYFVLAIDRKFLLPQTLQAVAKASACELRKGLKVIFKGEDGVDAGGVTKEFFQLLCEQLFDVNTGMWTTKFGNSNETWFNSGCTWNGEGYYLVGVLCGLAVYNSVILDVHFPHAIYRKLLGLPLGMEDLIDEDVQRGLKSLLDYDGDDVEDIFCLNFEVTWMDLGQERKKELKPGGSDIAVTSENKEEYVMLYVKWLLVDSIAAQYDEFERGFNKVMEDSSLEILLAEELELLVAGTPELDFYALEKSSEYEGGFDADSPVVKNIWKWIQSASLPTQEKFLKFCTGSSKGPIGGLGKMPFKIQRAGPDSQQLPTAHTCFNTLIVPDYGDDYEKLSDRLDRAVIECEGFGLQ